jgi:Ca-activated chloride channel family protein
MMGRNRKIMVERIMLSSVNQPTKSHKAAGHPARSGLILLMLALALVGSSASAQQGGSSPNLIIPRNQNSGSTTLELPVSPRQQNQPTQEFKPLVPQQQELEIAPQQLKAQPGYAQVTVTVTDPAGGYVTGLRKEDFQVFENDQQRAVQFFRRDLNAPVSVGILVDTSGSMDQPGDHPKIEQARAAIAQFLQDLNDKDDVFLFAFSDRPFLLQPFTTDHSLVMSRLGLLHAFGRTALYDVILNGLLMVQRGRYDKKALLVVTDGMDTASTSGLQQVIQQARQQGILVYSIGIGDAKASSGPSFGIGIGPFVFGSGAAGQDEVDVSTLQTLSTETGAKNFIISPFGDGGPLRQACESISNELREQYTIGYLSPDPDRGGYRSLRVDVPTHPDVTVRVRKGTTVGERTASADPFGSSP